MKNLLQSIKNTISYINHNNDNSIHIGYGIDDNYARCAGTSIASFCINNPTKSLVFHIITSGLAPNNLEKYSILSKKYSINIKNILLIYLFTKLISLTFNHYLHQIIFLYLFILD